MPTKKIDLTLVRIPVGVLVYLTMLGLIALAAYALWAGPEQFGVTESWPLEFYFVVSYLGTVLLGCGIIAITRVGPGLVRRML